MCAAPGIVTVELVDGIDVDEQMAPGHHRTGNGRLIGLLLIGLGTVWFLAATRFFSFSSQTVRAFLLMALGAWLVFTARKGRGGGRSLWPIIVGAVLVVSLLHHSGVQKISPIGVVGDPSGTPQSAADIQDDYQRAAGDLSLDLTNIPMAQLSGRQIPIRVGTGNVTVDLPAGTNFEAHGRVGVGKVTVCGTTLGDGLATHFDEPVGPSDAPRLDLLITVGAGDVNVMCDQPVSSTAPDPTTPVPSSLGPK